MVLGNRGVCFGVRLLVIASVAVALCCPGISSARDKDSKVVAVIVMEDSTDDQEALRDAIGAQLSDLCAVVELVPAKTRAGRDADPMSVASRLLDKGEIALAVWVPEGAAVVRMMTSGAADEGLTNRDLDTSEDWDVLCDGIGSMVRSMLMSTLLGTELTDANDADPPAEEADPDPGLVRFGAIVAGSIFTQSRVNPVIGGAHLAVGMYALSLVRLELGIDILARVKGDADGRELSLKRVPLRFLIGAAHELNSLSLGAGLSVVLDFTQVDGLPAGDTVDNTKVVYIGVGPELMIGWRFTEWLELSARGEFNWYKDSKAYVLGGEKAFEYGKFQVHVIVGLVFYFYSG